MTLDRCWLSASILAVCTGVTLEGEAAAAEQAAHYVPALNGLWNAQPFLPPPAAPLPECSSGCARAQPIKVPSSHPAFRDTCPL